MQTPAGEKVIYAVPGVPYEMTEMMERIIIPDLVRRSGEVAMIKSRGAALLGHRRVDAGRTGRLPPGCARRARSASRNDRLPRERYGGHQGSRDGGRDPTRRPSSRCSMPRKPNCGRFSETWFSGVDDENMEVAVSKLLLARGAMLGVAESVTGGLIASRLVSVAGASKWFRGGIVSYASEVKFDLLDVPEGPVVSEAAAIQMAKGVAARLGSAIGLSVTGVAGPDMQDGQPVGTVFIGVSDGDTAFAEMLKMPGDRDRIRQFSAIGALDILRRHLLGLR